MFCKAKRKKSTLFLCVFAISINSHISFNPPVTGMCWTKCFLHKFELHVFRTFAPCLVNRLIDKFLLLKEQTRSTLFFQGQPGSPFSSIFKLMLLRDVVTFRLLRWHCTVDANNLPKHGVNVTRNSTKTKTFYLSNKQLNVLSPVMLLASSVFLNSMETKIWHAQMQVG